MDKIADMLVKIKNAQAVGKATVSVPFSTFKYNICKLLKDEGFIEEVKKRGKRIKRIVIRLKYSEDKKPAIQGVKRISKPGRRIYLKAKDIYSPKSGMGILVISTSKGLMTSREAKRTKNGGEVLFEIW